MVCSGDDIECSVLNWNVAIEKRHPESQVEDDNELHYWVEHPVSRSMHGYIIGIYPLAKRSSIT